MSEASLFSAIANLREEITMIVKLTNKESTEQQINYRKEYIRKMTLYRSFTQLLDKEIEHQILRVSDHIRNLQSEPQ